MERRETERRWHEVDLVVDYDVPRMRCLTHTAARCEVYLVQREMSFMELLEILRDETENYIASFGGVHPDWSWFLTFPRRLCEFTFQGEQFPTWRFRWDV